MKPDINIGFIGLGNVGSKLANSILISNFNLFIYDLDIKCTVDLVKRGAILCTSIMDLVNRTTVIITCLPTPKSIQEVVLGKLGLINFINESHLWVEMSTTDEKEMLRLSSLVIQKKAKVLEAPVTGGQHRAAKGNISILVSGDRENFDRAMPILSEMGYEILFCGKLGNASTLKIVTNFLASINLLSLGEALMVSKKYGIDLETAFYAIKISSGNSFVHETETQVILNGSYNVGFTMDLVCKDLNLFDKLTKKFNIPAEMNNLVNKIFKKGLLIYGNRSLSTSIVKILEDICEENLLRLNLLSSSGQIQTWWYQHY